MRKYASGKRQEDAFSFSEGGGTRGLPSGLLGVSVCKGGVLDRARRMARERTPADRF